MPASGLRGAVCGQERRRGGAGRGSRRDGWRELQDSEREFFGDAYHPGDYLFTYQDGRPPHPGTIRQRFDRLAAAAGLSRITFHDLRHSYATGALRAGISPKVISERIGHANVGFFVETYAHVLGNDDREAAEQAAEFLLGDACEDGKARHNSLQSYVAALDRNLRVVADFGKEAVELTA